MSLMDAEGPRGGYCPGMGKARGILPGCRISLAAGLAWLVLAGLLGFVPNARAADATIDFHTDAPGTVLTDQYASADGLTFGQAPSGPSQLQPLVAATDPAAPAGTHVARQSCGEEMCLVQQWLEFYPGITHVSLDAGAVGSLENPVTLTAYDSGGTEIAHSTASIAAGTFRTLSVSDPPCTPLTIFICTSPIVFVSLDAKSEPQGTAIEFTNLTFGPTGTSVTPDFSLIGPSSVAISAQEGGKATITLRRFGGSNGAIGIGVSGQPTGVSVSSPAPITGGAPATNFDVSFSETSAVNPGTYSVTITGTPQSAQAGSVPHSITLKLVVEPVYGLRILGIEVNQGVQSLTIPALDEAQPTAPVAYNGVRLVQGMPTLVRVFADAPGIGTNGVTGATMTLTVRDWSADPNKVGKVQFTDTPDSAPSALFDFYSASTIKAELRDERRFPLSAYNFYFPHGLPPNTEDLFAHISPPAIFGSQQGAYCMDLPCQDEADLHLDESTAHSRPCTGSGSCASN
jgi:hypothetical protein